MNDVLENATCRQIDLFLTMITWGCFPKLSELSINSLKGGASEEFAQKIIETFLHKNLVSKLQRISLSGIFIE